MVDTTPVFKSSMWNRLAVTAFVSGVVLWLAAAGAAVVGVTNYNFVGWLWLVMSTVLFAVLSVAPVILGHFAILNSRRDMRGRGFGITGLVLGYAGVAISVVSVIILMILALHAFATGLSHFHMSCEPHCSW